MSRIQSLLTDSRFLSFVGVAAITALFFLGAKTLKVAIMWAVLASILLLIVWIGIWQVRRYRAKKGSDALESMLEQQSEQGNRRSGEATNAEIDVVKKRLLSAVKTIKTSKLGQVSGANALYELPWYITIGNPAAGKSTAIVNSGLKFPFDDGGDTVIKGIGGTRNCDWFFTSEGILLDTAGRYSIHQEDREEWMGFLGLLKKHRPRAPINGIIVTVNIGELIGNAPSFAINLAKNLRQRVQELTEKLEVFAPVYVLFTKADLIPGFRDFFLDLDWNERDHVWGATLPYEQANGNDLISLFDHHYEELYKGLRSMSVAQMSRIQNEGAPPGVLTFPSEFIAIKPALRAFIATLFEDNPFQFKPVFRGFYISSAIQSSDVQPLSNDRIIKKFALSSGNATPVRTALNHGYFLKELFSKVIFPDRNLVRQHTSRMKIRMRQIAVLGALGLLGLALGGWSWSYINNRSLLENVEQDLVKVVRLQEGKIDLQSRLEALEILQDRLIQLEHFNEDHPLSIGLGLYQGELLADKLRKEYYDGVTNLMLLPVKANLETFLGDVITHSENLKPRTTTTPARTPYKGATANDAEDAYNALKTYVMLSSHEHIDVGHLSDQMTRFWRGWLEANRGTMSREQMIRSAGRILSFHLEHTNDPAWPTINNNLAIVDEAREKLRNVVRGMPAAERVYSEIKARASTRFPPITVANLVGPDNASLVAGSHVVSGAFTVQAWHEYIQSAIKDAATSEQKNADWVLQASTKDDLTLEGSPEQIQKSLVAMYKRDYAEEWKQFVQGVSVTSFESFTEAINAMNRLGDPHTSPIGTLVKVIFEQTSWDNPALANVRLEKAQQGFVEWFKRSILQMSPGSVQLDVNISSKQAEVPMGPVGKEFAGFGRLMTPRDNSESLFEVYLKQLSKIRTRLNQLKNQGDPGPGSIKLMRETIDGGTSELAETLHFVDEQMLTGMPDNQRMVLRPLLLRPLLQSFAAIIKPSAMDLNKTWEAQVYEPFNRKLAIKYPFTKSNIEASPAEIAQIFGPDGAIAKYVESTMGSLVVRRGNTVEPRTWGDLGIILQPEFKSEFARWVSPLEGGAAASSGVGNTGLAQTVFMLRPQASPGTTGYVIEIDGQKLNYRNGPAQWANFVWPSTVGTPGVRISTTTFDGKAIEIINFPGRFGLEKLINSAQRSRQADGTFRLTWAKEGIEISIDLRLVSSPQAQATTTEGSGSRGLSGLMLPRTVAEESTTNEANAAPVQSPGTTAIAPRGVAQ
ncbi:type VI secretion system membrane subunit TssM [Quatrionicoccus australiensis]|uniref:type VI secretion system membrane subunit TssM n=1 Tax=Quatrionicoccus australiensis TaxID=138118 RepID=UPI001CFA2644|nr:type VI secretion system membrane subunit TssM [Quatrionicoccus australiensis]MCB4359519.1 type VI secretion system membrane subunit TssM [Quatrionicoccus australiensis]